MDRPELDVNPTDPSAVTDGQAPAGPEGRRAGLEEGAQPGPDPPPEAVASTAEPEPGRAVIPIPGTARRELPPERPIRAGGSFWQRIGLGGRQGLSKGERHDVLMARLSELERRLSESQNAIESRISALDRRLTQVWEVEEQLSYLLEIQQILTGLREQQSELGDRIHSNRRTLNLLVAALLVTAIAIASLALQPW